MTAGRARYWYLATPYSKYPGGTQAAYRMACRVAARLLRQGVVVYCPIAATHAGAVEGGLDLLDHEFWMPIDRPMMDGAVGVIVVRAPTWRESYGIGVEIREFTEAGKPVLYLDPDMEDVK